MKKLLICVCLLVVAFTQAIAQEKKAVIEFDKTTHDFGTFSEVDLIVSCKFVFMNSGDAPLVIHQAVASCGCTVPNYPKEPILPGGTGEIEVTYNGAGRYPGKFKKSITVRSNAKTEVFRLFIVGDMVEKGVTAADENKE